MTQIYLRPSELGQISGDTRRSLRLQKTLQGDSLGKISVVFAAPSDGDQRLAITSASFGKLSGLGADTTATPIELTFNNGETGHAAANGFIQTDFVEHPGLTLVDGDEIIIILDVASEVPNERHFLYAAGSTENWINVYWDAQTYQQTTVGPTDEQFQGSFAVYSIETEAPALSQSFVPSTSNATFGHDQRPESDLKSISQSYAVGEEAADRVVFAFFFLDGDAPGSASNPVFHTDTGLDIAGQIVGSNLGGGSYVAWAKIPTGSFVSLECSVPAAFGLIMEAMFSLYGGSDVLLDVAGDASTGSSVSGLDRAAGGTTIGWMLANSVTGWGGTSPALTSVFNRTVFSTNRRIEVGVALDTEAATGTTVSYDTAQRVLALSLAAPGAEEPAPVSGLASNSLTIAQSTTAAVKVKASASQSLSIAQTATAKVVEKARTSQSIIIGQTASAVAKIKARASQSLVIGSTGAAASPEFGTASHGIVIAQTAKASVAVKARADQRISIGSHGVAKVVSRRAVAIGSNDLVISQSATGSVRVAARAAQSLLIRSGRGSIDASISIVDWVHIQREVLTVQVAPEDLVLRLDPEAGMVVKVRAAN